MKIRKLTIALVTLLSLFILSGCGGSGSDAGSDAKKPAESSGGAVQTEKKTYNFRMTHVTQPTHIWNKFALKFGEELAQRSEGRMKLEVFPASQLGPEQDMLQQMSTGTIDFALITVPYLSTRVEDFVAWNLPFMFNDIKSTTEARNTKPAQDMLKKLDSINLVGLDYFFAGNHHMITKGFPVNKMADLKSKRIRITGGPALVSFWENAGATPVSMGLGELYSSLQTGVIDGASIDTNATVTEKYSEVVKYFNVSNYMAFPGVTVASKKVYEGISAEDQKIIKESVEAATEWGIEQLIGLETENIEKLKEVMTVNEDFDKASFDAAKQKVWEKYSKNPSVQEFIDAVQK